MATWHSLAEQRLAPSRSVHDDATVAPILIPEGERLLTTGDLGSCFRWVAGGRCAVLTGAGSDRWRGLPPGPRGV